MMRRVLPLLSMRSFLTACCILAAAFAPAGAKEWQVTAGGRNLQDALENAQAGDVFRLAPGKHHGPVVIKKSITLRGASGTRIEGSGTGSVVTVEAPAVTITGLTLTGSGLSQKTLDAGIKLTQKARGADIENNRLLNNLTGIDVHGAKDVRIARNLIEGRQDLRMNERGNGLYVWNAPGLTAEFNTIRHGRDGIFVNTSHKDRFLNNRFEDLRFAIHYMYGNNGEISGNVSVGNDIGFALMFSNGLTIENNLSVRDRNHGLMLNYANHARIVGNRVEQGGEKCLFMYNANKNTVEGNRFEGCPIGIHFTAGSADNHFAGNAFIGNQTQVKYVGSRNLDWSENGRGNFWSDLAAFDLNGDGIADSTYRPNDMVDQLLWTQPAAKLLTGSPAVQLLQWTQSQFPSLLPGGIVDSAPLMYAPEFITPHAGVQE